MRVLFVSCDFQTVSAGDVLHFPIAGAQMSELWKSLVYELVSNLLKFLAGHLAR
jgi:hypothetical protein